MESNHSSRITVDLLKEKGDFKLKYKAINIIFQRYDVEYTIRGI